MPSVRLSSIDTIAGGDSGPGYAMRRRRRGPARRCAGPDLRLTVPRAPRQSKHVTPPPARRPVTASATRHAGVVAAGLAHRFPAARPAPHADDDGRLRAPAEVHPRAQAPAAAQDLRPPAGDGDARRFEVAREPDDEAAAARAA